MYISCWTEYVFKELHKNSTSHWLINAEMLERSFWNFFSFPAGVFKNVTSKSRVYPDIWRYVIQTATQLIPLILLAGFCIMDIHVVSRDHPSPVYLHTGWVTQHKVTRLTALIPSLDVGIAFLDRIDPQSLTFSHIWPKYKILSNDVILNSN